YALAWLAGRPTSLTAFRTIQVCFTLLAAGVALACCRRLATMSAEDGTVLCSPLWNAIWLLSLTLIATNSLTNPVVHNLHADALAQLVCVLCYWLLLEYAAPRNKRLLWLMALLPAAGFLVRQHLVIWFGLFGAYLACWDRPRSWGRLLGYLLVALAMT